MSRADRLAGLVAERELDVLLVNDPVNLRYVTGFTGTNGLAVVGAGPDGVRRFITDFRYLERAGREVADFETVRGERDLLESVAAGLPERRPLRVGFDDAHVSVRAHRRLGEALEGVELVAAGGVVEQLRAVKEPQELERIRAAAAVADQALAAMLGRGLAGRTEREVALDLEDEMRHRGAEPSFPSIVAAGPQGALPHADARAVEIPRDTLVIVDWGARVDGYCSDCTRTFATGGGVDAEAREVYDLVARAQATGLEAVRAGVTGRDADAAARAVIAGAGQGEHFGHGLGHGVGLEVHEGPRLAKTGGDEPLQAGNVVTVEPGIYLPARFGVRVEDLVVVTAQGVEILSSSTKDLITLS